MPDEFDDVMELIGRTIRRAEALDDTALDPDRLARWAFTLDGAVKRLRVLDGEARTLLAEMVPVGQETRLDGVLSVEVKKSSYRTEWDNDLLRREVMRFATYDPATGAQRAADEALAAVGELFPLTGSSGFRVGAAKKLIPGFDPDEFCHTEIKTSVSITEPPTTVPKKEAS